MKRYKEDAPLPFRVPGRVGGKGRNATVLVRRRWTAISDSCAAFYLRALLTSLMSPLSVAMMGWMFPLASCFSSVTAISSMLIRR